MWYVLGHYLLLANSEAFMGRLKQWLPLTSYANSTHANDMILFSAEDPYGTGQDLQFMGKELQRRLLKLLEESPNRKMTTTERKAEPFVKCTTKPSNSRSVVRGELQLYEEVRLPPPRQFRDVPLPPEPFRDTIPPPPSTAADSVDNLLYHMYETVKEARWNDQHRRLATASQKKRSEKFRKLPISRLMN